ncbi:MAG: hypothetical protein OEM52_08830 [bacterium]|nr:hypothetical protein [bacterium]
MFRKITLSVFIGLLATTVFADRRNFVWTYQTRLVPRGMTELEFYQTVKLKSDAQSDWELRGEIEHGISNRLDFAVYTIFSQSQGQSLKWLANQYRLRWRLSEPGAIPFDPVLYFEYQRPTSLKSPNKYEFKLLLAKQSAKLLYALNPVYELKAGPDAVHETGLDAALGWEFSPAITAGIESTSRLEFEEDETVTESYFGPTFSFSSGEWWLTMGAAWGVTEEDDPLKVRMLLGVGL